jgi:drug/metabolite transporter (DMT)-like permease
LGASLLVILSACGFGTIPIFTSMAERAGASLLNVLALRFVFGGALLAAGAWAMRALRAPMRRVVPVLVFAGGAQAFIAFVALSALDYMPAAPLSFLFYTYPAWVAVVAAVRGSERLAPARLVALALSLGGIAIMVGAPAGASLPPAGVALALVSAVAYALYIPMIAHFQEQLSETTTAVYAACGAAAILLVIDIVRGGLTLSLHRTAWTAIGGLAVWSTAIAFVAFLRGLRVLGPVRAAIVSTVEPFWTAILGAVLLSQHVPTSTMVGGTLIAGAVVVLQVRTETGDGRPKTVDGRR